MYVTFIYHFTFAGQVETDQGTGPGPSPSFAMPLLDSRFFSII